MPIVAIALVLLGVVQDAGAAAPEAGAYRVSITPMVGYRTGGDFEDDATGEEIELEDDGSFGILINAPYNSLAGDAYTEWEFYFSKQSVGVDAAPAAVDPSLDIDISYFLLGGTYVGPGEGVRPFFAAEIGVANLSPDGPDYDSDTVFAFSAGGGAQVFPANRVGLRIEGRVLGAVVESDSAIFCRSGPTGSACAFRTNGDLLWQWDLSAGVTVRF